MNEERDREWGLDAVRLWKEWVDLNEAEHDIRKSRPERLDLSDPSHLLWTEAVEKVWKARLEKWAACQAAMVKYRKKNRLPPFPFCPR